MEIRELNSRNHEVDVEHCEVDAEHYQVDSLHGEESPEIRDFDSMHHDLNSLK